MRHNTPTEPGLIRIFRFFVIAETIAFLFVPLGEWLFTGSVSDFYKDPFYYLFLQALFLSIYLSIPWLQRKLRSLYLLIALLIATLIPILIVNIDLTTRFLNGQGIDIYRLWALLPLLMIALVPAAWQYDFQRVFLVNTGLGIFDGFYIILLSGGFNPELLMPLFAIFIRVVTLNLVALMITELVFTQREQRRDLMRANLKLSQQTLVQDQLAVSRERNRLARELHDTLAHTLSGLSVQLEAIHTILPEEQADMNAMIETALYTARDGLEETRRALKALRAEPLDDLGIQLAIQNLIANLEARTNLTFHVDISTIFNTFNHEEEQMIYRITQESLENIVQHANATNVWLQLELESDGYVLSIRDDGSGFDAMSNTKLNDRLGIKGMQERAEMLNASLEIDSQPGKGTLLKLKMRKK
ncbi:MAG: sensor histidine kinase [Anaerolineaceae bacterium]|nr:sensor histidine kinase [Anaerolineaceae bacterium]